jgi:hypothetical protein
MNSHLKQTPVCVLAVVMTVNPMNHLHPLPDSPRAAMTESTTTVIVTPSSNRAIVIKNQGGKHNQ